MYKHPVPKKVLYLPGTYHALYITELSAQVRLSISAALRLGVYVHAMHNCWFRQTFYSMVAVKVRLNDQPFGSGRNYSACFLEV